MKTQTLSLASFVLVLASTNPAWAQPTDIDETIAQEGSPTVLNTGPRVADARRVTLKGGGRVEEVKGVCVSDPRDKQLRFEADGQIVFALPFDRITAMHYETAVEPSKWGWPLKTTKNYLAIHYADSTGRAAFETVRLSARDVTAMLNALETHAGRKIDRSLARQSFLGIPIRAAIGDRVTVTDLAGYVTEGTVTNLSASSLALDGSTIEGVSVRTVRLRRSRGHDALRGFGFGFLVGGAFGALAGSALGGDSHSAMEGAAIVGTYLGGVGAVVSAAVASYRFRAARDVYLGGTPGASRSSAITMVPVLAKQRKGVAVSVRF